MTAPISRGYVIGTVEKGERKSVGESNKQLVEFYLEGFGLRINAWGDLADSVPGVGSFVMVEGAFKTRQYKNAQNEDRQTTEITASSVTALDGATPIEDKPAPKPEPIKPPSAGF